MQTVTLEFNNHDARYILYALRKRYGRDKRATLRGVCDLAVRTEVAAFARAELALAEKALDEEYSGKEASDASDSD